MQPPETPENALPAAFESLAPLVRDWALATERERRDKRAASSFDELTAYYALVGPRMRSIAAHLDAFPMDTLPEAEQSLLRLALMFMEVSLAVEFYGQPEVPRGFPRDRWEIRGPV